jgi:3-hydroxybutyryl-CoA dehydrogenase
MAGEAIHIIGAGVMGSGLAEHLARTGHAVVLLDRKPLALSGARERIRELARLACFLGSPERCDPDEVLGRVTFTTETATLKSATWLLENVTEDREIKRLVYRECDALCPPECIFISNTSALPITELARMTGRPDRVIGVHFMNPVARIPTVEMIPGEETSDETIARTAELLDHLGKRPVVIRDGAGFVSNRLLMSMVNEAARLVEEGIATPQEIDRICRECFGHRMGPLETADLIGLDTIARTLEVLHAAFPGDRYQVCRRLATAVEAGELGRKSKRGFYTYE